MKLITSSLVCLCIAGCSADDKTTAPIPAPHTVATTFFGLRVGALTPLPECVIDPPDGPYHEQPVMPCFVSLEPVFGFDGRKIKWAPDFPAKITILFHPEQVPVGLDPRADGIIQSGRLAEVAVRQSTHSPPEYMETFIPLLQKKYGPIAGFTSEKYEPIAMFTSNRNMYWHQPNMDVIYFPGGATSRSLILARSTAYKEWLQRSAPSRGE